MARSGGSMLGLAVDGRGRVYACDAGNGEVVRWDAAGGLEVVARGPGGGELDTPNMLAFDPRGALYVTCSGEDGSPSVMRVVAGAGRGRGLGRRVHGVPERVRGVAPTATSCSSWIRTGSRCSRSRSRRTGRAGGPQSVASMPDTDADGVALDAEGALWVTLYRPDGIVRIGPDGAVETVVDDHLAQTFDAPTNLAFVGPELDRRRGGERGRPVPVDRRPGRAGSGAALPGRRLVRGLGAGSSSAAGTASASRSA